MDEPTLFRIDYPQPGVLKLDGELDIFTGPQVVEALVSLDGQTADVDLSGVTFIDSSGLKAMLRIRREHHDVRFVRPSAHVARIAEITGLTTVFGFDEASD